MKFYFDEDDDDDDDDETVDAALSYVLAGSNFVEKMKGVGGL